MKRTLFLPFVLSVVGLPLAAADSAGDARALLDKAVEAAKAVQAARVSAEVVPTGAAVNFMSASEGTSVMDGWAGTLPARFVTDIEAWKPGSDEKTVLTGGGNGDTYFLIDHSSRKAYADMDPLVMGSNGYTLQTLGMTLFVSDTPYEEELKAEKLELRGVEEVNGERCHKLYVDYGSGQEAIWYFSGADYLPRKNVYIFAGGFGEGTVEKTITKLEINPDPEPGLFAFKLPEGYEQIDDFAP